MHPMQPFYLSRTIHVKSHLKKYTNLTTKWKTDHVFELMTGPDGLKSIGLEVSHDDSEARRVILQAVNAKEKGL